MPKRTCYNLSIIGQSTASRIRETIADLEAKPFDVFDTQTDFIKRKFANLEGWEKNLVAMHLTEPSKIAIARKLGVSKPTLQKTMNKIYAKLK